jgi:hypothetical protein
MAVEFTPGLRLGLAIPCLLISAVFVYRSFYNMRIQG